MTNDVDPLSLFPLEASVTSQRGAESPIGRPDAGLAPPRAAASVVSFSTVDAERVMLADVGNEVTRIGKIVLALEARISKLTEKDQPLALGDARARQLEQRGAEITAQLQQNAAAGDAQRKDITARVTQARQIAEQLSGLDARIGKLIDRGHALEQADGLVGQLEHRLAETTAELKRARKAHDELGREVPRLQQQISTLRDSARKQVGKVAAQDANAQVKPWTAMGVVAGVTGVALAGIIAARSAQVAPPERNARTRQSTVAASVPVLPGRPLSLALSSLPTRPAASRAWRYHISSNGSDVSTRIEPAPPRVPQAANRPRTEPTSDSSLVKDERQPRAYIGALGVQSDPAGSAVFLDRTYVGETPVQLTDLRAGSHVVWIQRDGYERWTASVLVAADKQTQIAATLKPERDR